MRTDSAFSRAGSIGERDFYVAAVVVVVRVWKMRDLPAVVGGERENIGPIHPHPDARARQRDEFRVEPRDRMFRTHLPGIIKSQQPRFKGHKLFSAQRHALFQCRRKEVIVKDESFITRKDAFVKATNGR